MAIPLFKETEVAIAQVLHVYIEGSKINFQGNLLLVENEGDYGGAMTLYQNLVESLLR